MKWDLASTGTAQNRTKLLFGQSNWLRPQNFRNLAILFTMARNVPKTNKIGEKITIGHPIPSIGSAEHFSRLSRSHLVPIWDANIPFLDKSTLFYLNMSTCSRFNSSVIQMWPQKPFETGRRNDIWIDTWPWPATIQICLEDLHTWGFPEMGVPPNHKSSILIGCSIINHPIPIYGNLHMFIHCPYITISSSLTRNTNTKGLAIDLG